MSNDLKGAVQKMTSWWISQALLKWERPKIESPNYPKTWNFIAPSCFGSCCPAKSLLQKSKWSTFFSISKRKFFLFFRPLHLACFLGWFFIWGFQLFSSIFPKANQTKTTEQLRFNHFEHFEHLLSKRTHTPNIAVRSVSKSPSNLSTAKMSTSWIFKRLSVVRVCC